MRAYVASGLQNRERAAQLMDFLRSLGHEITYDWTQHGDVRSQGDDVMMQVAVREIFAVSDAEFMIILLPGSAGTHTELGSAISTRSNKRILVWSEREGPFSGGPEDCVFYHHPAVERVCCSFEALCEQLKAQMH